MVLVLMGDVFARLVQQGRAHRKNAKSRLPPKICQRRIVLFDPDAGDAFEFLPIGLRDAASHSAEDMHMIFDASDNAVC